MAFSMAMTVAVVRRMMPAILAAGASLLLMDAAPAAEGSHFVWFGTYTGKATSSEGIYVSRFDAATGTLSAPELAITTKNPSFLATHPTLPVLYAVSEAPGPDGKPAGVVTSFAIDAATGRLTTKNAQSSGGSGPCHLAVDRAGKVVVAANYGGGSSLCLGLTADGSLKPIAADSPGGFIQHVFDRAGEAGINARRQEKPHGHSADVAPDGRFAFVCDLGLDRVFVHALDTDNATIAPHASAKVTAGAGPRHFALHPNGRFAYVVNELDMTVTGFTFDPQAGTLTTHQTLSTLPADVTDREGFSCAEIAVHPTGRFVYASNRGHDTIAVYGVEETSGRLAFRGVVPIEGKTPRHFALSPDGRFLLAEGQHSNSVTIFTIDQATGMLGFTGRSIDVPSPVSAVFRAIE